MNTTENNWTPGGARATIPLPGFVRRRLEAELRAHLAAGGGEQVDFEHPAGEPGLLGPDSVSWRIFRNPVALLVGGIAAVLMEFAEPRVRTGVWEHTTFRTDPLGRMRRTGLAAMVTVYGPRSTAESMIAHVRRLHERVRGTTPDGVPYRADDPELLRWVHATAAYGFLEAYSRFVRRLEPPERDRYYAENAPIGQLYGADEVPDSEAALQRLIEVMLPRLKGSAILGEFLSILSRTRILPSLPLRATVERMLVRAAVELVPPRIRDILDPPPRFRLRRREVPVVRVLGALSDRIALESHPAAPGARRLKTKAAARSP